MADAADLMLGALAHIKVAAQLARRHNLIPMTDTGRFAQQLHDVLPLRAVRLDAMPKFRVGDEMGQFMRHSFFNEAIAITLQKRLIEAYAPLRGTRLAGTAPAQIKTQSRQMMVPTQFLIEALQIILQALHSPALWQ
jgi:hypothetical protein